MQEVIFDMDGTLIDTQRVSQAAWRRAAQDFRIEIPERILHAFVGCSIPTAMKMIDDEFGDPAFTERLFNRRHEIFDATWEDEIELKPGAAEAVAAVRERGLAAALATSSVRDLAITSMERLGLMVLFDAAVFDDDIRRLRRRHRASQTRPRCLPRRRRPPWRRTHTVRHRGGLLQRRASRRRGRHAHDHGPRLQRAHARDTRPVRRSADHPPRTPGGARSSQDAQRLEPPDHPPRTPGGARSSQDAQRLEPRSRRKRPASCPPRAWFWVRDGRMPPDRDPWRAWRMLGRDQPL